MVAADKEYIDNKILKGELSPVVAAVEIALKQTGLNTLTFGMINVENNYTIYHQSGIKDEEISELIGQCYIEQFSQYWFQQFVTNSNLPTSAFAKTVYIGADLYKNYGVGDYCKGVYGVDNTPIGDYGKYGLSAIPASDFNSLYAIPTPLF